MPIIEIACFSLESSGIQAQSKPFLADAPHDQPTATLRFHLSHAIRALSKASKHPFYLLQDLQDSLIIYYMGKWPSIDAYSHFNGSPDHKELLDALESCKAVMRWRGFYDVVQYHNWESSALSALLHKDKGPMGAKVVGLTRHNVSNVDEFEKKLSHGMPYLEKYSGHKGAAGRKIETGFDFDESLAPIPEETKEQAPPQRDETILLSGWQSRDQYDDFRDTKDYQEFARIREVTTWFERVSQLPAVYF